MAAAAAAIMAGSGDGEEAGEESDELLGGAVDVTVGADVEAGAVEVASVKMSTALKTLLPPAGQDVR